MNMFQPSAARTPEEYIAELPEPRRSEIQSLHDLIRQTAPELSPKMWGAIIGYGQYHYKYPSGREGDWSVLGLSSRKDYISFYASCVTKDGQYVAEKYKKDLPKASIGKSCIRFKHLTDVNQDVLKKIIKESEASGGMGAVNG